MNGWLGTAQNERGVALPMALFALVMLSGLLLVFLGMAGMEPQIAGNLNNTTQARYVADAGIEWAYDQLIQQTEKADGDFKAAVNVILGLPTNGVMTPPIPLPGLPATSGTFSVTIRNDNLANDDQITGQPVDPGGLNTDTNEIVILTSTGTYNGTTRQIRQVVSHANLFPPGGLNLPGVGTNTTFTGNSFTITGNDTNLNDKPGTCPSVLGIGVADKGTELLVETSVAKFPDNITGKGGTGNNTIEIEASLTPDKIKKFVDAIRPYADISLQASAANHLQYQNIGNTCSANLSDATCWGTIAKPNGSPGQPKIVYIKGTLDPAQAFYALSISGKSQGAGILIIEDGDAFLSGDFRWEGLIIITGQHVGLRYGGGGEQTVYGGVVVNETSSVNSEVEVDAAGNPKIDYSCQALNNVRNMRKLFRVTAWREL